ncbi:MAG: hypothetical protein LC768_17180 [Acidobacteria bacterium]|nr:hypothetical protein [Acidobacteriota bacterium]MCA1640026.1 hypothetical protein [Acidobacteriota bacterium]
MTSNAGFKFNNSLSGNSIVTDFDTGQSVTLEELAHRTAEREIQRKVISLNESLRDENWRIIESKLDTLLDEEYDEDFLPPTDFAFSSVKKLLLSINNFLGYEMSIPAFIVPDGEGGVRIEWKVNNKHLRLALSEKRMYLYFEHNSKYNGIPDFNAEQLVEKLRWLNQK